MGNYHIIGRAGAGSLIAEFLFREAGIDYDISFPDPAEVKSPDFFAANPLGRIPVLICPNGTQVFETLAIIHHITSRFGDLAPPQGTPQNDRYHQYLALLATSVYPAYHRHNSGYGVGDDRPDKPTSPKAPGIDDSGHFAACLEAVPDRRTGL